MNILSKLCAKSGVSFRVNYSFVYCQWYERLKEHILSNPSVELSLNWSFRAHHFKSNVINWKREHFEGGGALRFYGIHIIGLLCSVGYSDVSYSKCLPSVNEPYIWIAEFSGKNLPIISINVATNVDIEEFSIHSNLEVILNLKEPFQLEKPLSIGIDKRTSIISQILGSFKYGDEYFNLKYQEVNKLWNLVEVKI